MEQTYGENRLKMLLAGLPEHEYFGFSEPRLEEPQGTLRYPDFVVIVRSRGVLAIEVKDWKEIDLEESDYAYFRVFTQGMVKSLANPQRTAKKYADNLIDLFEKRREMLALHQGAERLSFPCEGIVVFTHQDERQVQKMVEKGLVSADRALPAEALASPDEFRRRIEALSWTWQLKQPLSEAVCEAIANEINAQSVFDGKSQRKIGDLTQAQQNIISAPLPNRGSSYVAHLIRGAVGSGKTIVLTKRAERISELRPDLRILVTAFQLDLVKDLRRRIRNEQIEVKPFFGLCKEILGDQWPATSEYRGEAGPGTLKKWVEDWAEYVIGAGLDIDTVAVELAHRKDGDLVDDRDYLAALKQRKTAFSAGQIQLINELYAFLLEHQAELKGDQEIVLYEDVPARVLKALVTHKLKRSYDVIMVDEAQDWAPKWISVLKMLLRAGGYLLFCDDPAQSLWRFFNWEQKGIHHAEKFVLDQPERTTAQIMDFAQTLFDIEQRLHVGYDKDVYPVRTDHLLQGELPEVYLYADAEQEQAGVRELVRRLLEEGQAGSEIGLLCPYFPQAHSWSADTLIHESQVYAGHFNVMKGLEFHTVIIPHLGELFPAQDEAGEALQESTLRKLFIALTRAKRRVILTTVGDFPPSIAALLHLARCVDLRGPVSD